MWKEISEPWKAAFSQGWLSYQKGSIPIGAVVTDEAQNIISFGRNKLYENINSNPKIAHAEIECLQNLNILKYPNLKQYTLFTCMEPCPMCMGTIVMSNFRKVKIAAKDSYCGATRYCDTDPYIKSKNIDIEFMLGDLQVVQLVLQSYFEIKNSNGKIDKIVKIFKKDSPIAVSIAMDFYKQRFLDECVKNQTDFSVIYDSIITKL